MITIYGRPSCGYCDMAKTVCENAGLQYRYVDMIAEQVSVQTLCEIVGADVRSVPQIFVDDKYIGGFNELRQFVLDNRENKGLNFLC